MRTRRPRSQGLCISLAAIGIPLVGFEICCILYDSHWWRELLPILLSPITSDPMKQGIHPKYVETKITCGCGNSFTTRSTRPEMKVDICSNCHPFYTGKLKYVDTAGRIEKFKNKFAGSEYGKKK